MHIIPWSYLETWSCYGCGDVCCTSSVVPLTLNEWLRIIQNFGVQFTEPRMDGFFLQKTADNRCVFQYGGMGKHLCSIQAMKPRACKLWPFKIHMRPLYGMVRESAFNYKGRTFYVYVDAACRGLRLGTPAQHFMKHVIPEFIEIALGNRETQVYSTVNSTLLPSIKPRVARLVYL